MINGRTNNNQYGNIHSLQVIRMASRPLTDPYMRGMGGRLENGMFQALNQYMYAAVPCPAEGCVSAKGLVGRELPFIDVSSQQSTEWNLNRNDFFRLVTSSHHVSTHTIGHG